MLYPEIRGVDEGRTCTCGARNFRLCGDSRPTFRMFELTIPRAPHGSSKFYLCEDCIKKITIGECEKYEPTSSGNEISSSKKYN